MSYFTQADAEIKGHESQRRGEMTQLFRVYVNGGQVDHVDPGIAQKLARIKNSNPDYWCQNLTLGDVLSVWIQSAGYEPRTPCAHWDIITQSLDKRPSP